MVLTEKKKMFFIVVLVLNAILAYSQLHPSGLMQYGESIDRERLELLESRQAVSFVGRLRYSITGTYIIRNSGYEYQSTLGILFSGLRTTPLLVVAEIKFFVDGNHVQHIEREYFGKFVMGETTVEQNMLATTWALIDVLFPENSIVIIQVQYETRFNVRHRETSMSYNTILEIGPFTNLDYWRGPTKFSLEVINRPDNSASWIRNIRFFHATDSRNDINTGIYLRNLQSLQTTDLMRIQRLNGNTFKIDFTEEFSNNYQRRFVIDTSSLADMEAGSFLNFIYPERTVSFFNGISGRGLSTQELEPYEFIFLTNAQLRIMRNVFFARHGFIFQSADLIDIFTNWFIHPLPNAVFYVPNPNFHEGMFTDAERANIAIIQRLEALVRD